MKSFKQAYDNIFSLGYNCSAAYQLRENNLRTTSGPFDWIGVDDLSIIADNLENSFSKFLLPENMVMDEQQNDEIDYYTVIDTITGIKSIHDVPKFGASITDGLNELNAKFRRRVNRFFDYIQNGNKTLLIRRMKKQDDLLHLSKSLSQRFPGKCVILGVKHAKNEPVLIKQIQDDVFLATMDCDSDNLLKIENFTGHFQNWKNLLHSFCELKNPALLPPMHHERIQMIKENIQSRKLLIWGLADEFPILEHCFRQCGWNDFVVFDRKKAHYDKLPKEIIVDELSLIHKDKYYIVVSCKKYKEETVDMLRRLGFQNTEDYLYFFKENTIFN
ncbi:MAG: papain-like cysteine peptidase [Oscillospiraceae bacterium]|nr:papain-like cysteine peptidase [Oscillospiraceae bacterium]